MHKGESNSGISRYESIRS